MLSGFFFEILETAARIARHGSGDSSPQAGYNYLCGREDLMIRSDVADDDGTSFQWLEHMYPVSTLAVGRSAEVHKIPRLTKSMIFESRHLFPRYRIQLKSWLSDQSTEKKVTNSTSKLAPVGLQALPADQDNLVEWSGGINNDFLWPLCIEYNDLLHILFDGALQTAVKSYCDWPETEKGLKAFVAILKNQSSRDVLVQDFKKQGASADELKYFNSFGTKVLDWEWQKLEETLEKLNMQPRFKIVQKYWNLERILKVDSGSELTAKCYREVDNALQRPGMDVDMAIVYHMCVVVGSWSRWLRGCKCHGHLLVNQTSHQRKVRLMKAAGCRHGRCPWEGRRGVELVLGMMDIMIADIRGKQSVFVNAALSKCAPQVR
jgi:hypothetical protein